MPDKKMKYSEYIDSHESQTQNPYNEVLVTCMNEKTVKPCLLDLMLNKGTVH